MSEIDEAAEYVQGFISKPSLFRKIKCLLGYHVKMNFERVDDMNHPSKLEIGWWCTWCHRSKVRVFTKAP